MSGLNRLAHAALCSLRLPARAALLLTLLCAVILAGCESQQDGDVRIAVLGKRGVVGLIRFSQTGQPETVSLQAFTSGRFGQNMQWQDLGEYQGELVALRTFGTDFAAFFADGSVFTIPAAADGKKPAAPLQKILDSQPGLSLLDAVIDGNILWALGVDKNGSLRLYTHNLKLDKGTPASRKPAAGWRTLAPEVAMIGKPALARLTLLHKRPTVFWRTLTGGLPEPGIQWAVYAKSTWTRNLTPSGRMLSGRFAVSVYNDGILLMQEPAAFTQESEQGALAFFNPGAGWTAFPPVVGIRENGTTLPTVIANDLAWSGSEVWVARLSPGGLSLLCAAEAQSQLWQAAQLPPSLTPPDFPLWLVPLIAFLVSILFVYQMRARQQKQIAADAQKPAVGLARDSFGPGRLASPLDRAMAMLLDLVIVMPLPIFAYVQSLEEYMRLVAQGRQFEPYLLLLAGFTIYSFFAELFFGQTFGKWVFNMQVSTLSGGKPVFHQHLARSFARFVDFYPFSIAGFPLFYAIFAVAISPRRQRLGDWIAGTIVVKVIPLRLRKVVLASASPRRRTLLSEMGCKFEVIVTDVDESAIQCATPRETAESLARCKADAAAEKAPADAIIIAADTIVVCDGEILGKPKDREDARRMLRLLANRKHEVITGVCLLDKMNGQFLEGSDSTEVTMRALSETEIDMYLNTGEADDKAGAYAIQGRAGAFVTATTGSVSNVIGLPVEMLREMLDEIS